MNEHSRETQGNKKTLELLVPVSYMGSGSSALTDLLSEYEGVENPLGSFEFVFLHCPDGLFDLEDKLLVGNNALRSDEALHRFLDKMAALYQGRWWVGQYKQRLCPDFLPLAQQFVDELIEERPDFYWYEQERVTKSQYPYLALRKILSLVTLGRLQLPKPLRHPQMWLSYPKPEAFYAKASEFVWAVLQAWQRKAKFEGQKLILDQFLLPHNLHRLPHYFPERLTAFVLERDPRDVFLSNKYIWAPRGEQVPYPTEVRAFVSMYRSLRESERPLSSQQVHRLQFEDLVYRYEETKQRLEACLGLSPAAHLRPRQRFVPEKSIHNTQLWLSEPAWQAEADFILQELPTYCYDFPYARQGRKEEIF